MMKTLIKVLFVLLCLGAVASGAAWLYARDQQQKAALWVTHHEEDRASLNAQLRKQAIGMAEEHYLTMLSIEKISYDYDLTLVKNSTERLLVETQHSINLLRYQLDRDHTVAQAKEK